MSELDVKTPWDTHPRSHDKNQLAKFVLQHDGGIFVSYLRDLLHETTDAAYDADDRLVRRWIERYTGEYLWAYDLDKDSQKCDRLVFAREELTKLGPFTESREYSPYPTVASHRWREENLIGISNDELLSQFPALESILGIVYSGCDPDETADSELNNSDEDDECLSPEDFVRGMLEDNMQLVQGQREEIARQFTMDVDVRLDKIASGKILGNQYVGYNTLFKKIYNASDRAERLGYRRAMHVVLTCSPHCHDSLEDMAETLGSSNNNSPRELDYVIQHLGRHGDWAGAEMFSSVRNGRLHRIGVIEIMDNGMFHVHFLLFGANRSDLDIGESELAEYWSKKREVGEQVRISDVHLNDDGWVISKTGRRIIPYLCKVPGMIKDIKDGESAYELTIQGKPHWKLGVLWATNGLSQLVLRAEDLKSPVDKDVVDDSVPSSVQKDTAVETEQVPDWINTPVPDCRDTSEMATQNARDLTRKDFDRLTERDIWLMRVAPNNCRKQGTFSRVFSEILIRVWMIIRTATWIR